MKLLLRPTVINDESSESYLLRLAAKNGLTFFELAKFLNILLAEESRSDSLTLPTKLSAFNFCFAKESSAARYRAIQKVSRLTRQSLAPILDLANLRSACHYSPNYTAVLSHGVDLPRVYLRQSEIPVCPQCLSESAYIRHSWHWAPIIVCPVHGLLLMDRCPKCQLPLNYLKSERIESCDCGYDLRQAKSKSAPNEIRQLTERMLSLASDELARKNILLQQTDVHCILGALLWWEQTDNVSQNSPRAHSWTLSKLKCALAYFEHWPTSFETIFVNGLLEGMETLVRPVEQSALRSVAGNHLVNCQYLPHRSLDKNFIRATMLGILHAAVQGLNPNLSPDIGKLLVSSLEAANLLDTTLVQIARLVEEGMLPFAVKSLAKMSVHPAKPCFSLESVCSLWEWGCQSNSSHLKMYLSSW